MTTWVCVASGPSLTRADVDYCRGRAKVIVVNDCFRLAPWADYLYAADHRWWICRSLGEGWTNVDLSKRIFEGERVTCDPGTAEMFGLRYVPHHGGAGLGVAPIVKGTNSGAEAVNFAVNEGAQRIILLGYDMGATGTGHWFGDHPETVTVEGRGVTSVEPMNTMTAQQFEQQCKEFGIVAEQLKGRGIECINCTRESALTCFPRATLEDVL